MEKTNRSSQLLAILIPCIFLICTGGRGAAQAPFTDGFESGDFIAGGWNASGGAVVTTQAPSRGLYCAEGPAAWGLAKVYGPVSGGLLTVEFDAKAGQTNTSCLIFRVMDGASNTSAGIFFDTQGNIIAVDGAGGNLVPVLPYQPNEWYAFRLVLDLAAKTFDMYIDNVLVANGFDFYSAGFTSALFFSWSSVASSGTAWLDGVSITTGPTGIGTVAPGESLSVYPNPFTDRLQAGTGTAGPFRFELYDGQMRQVMQIKLMEPGTIVDAALLPGGIYFLRLRQTDGLPIVQWKLVKR